MLTPRENEIIDELFEDIFPEERDARANTISPKGYDTSSELLRNPPSPQGEGLKEAADMGEQEQTNTVRPYDRGSRDTAERLYAPWTDEEDAYIIDARKRGETAHETASKLNRTEQAVYARRKALGVSRMPSEKMEKKTRTSNRFSLDTTRESGFINEEFDKCFEEGHEEADTSSPPAKRENPANGISHSGAKHGLYTSSELLRNPPSPQGEGGLRSDGLLPSSGRLKGKACMERRFAPHNGSSGADEYSSSLR